MKQIHPFPLNNHCTNIFFFGVNFHLNNSWSKDFVPASLWRKIYNHSYLELFLLMIQINCRANMYTDGNNYPNLKKLPSDLEDALEHLSKNVALIEAFGEKIVTSYLKLKEQELKDFNSKETFSKKDPITDWEKTNTLDC